MRHLLLAGLLWVACSSVVWAGSARNFDGTDDQFKNTTINGYEAETVTVSGWFFTTTVATGDYLLGGSGNNSIVLNAAGDNDNIECGGRWTGGNGQWESDSTTIIVNTWTYITCTYDGSAVGNDAIIYQEGYAVNTTETEGPPTGSMRNLDGDFCSGERCAGDDKDLNGQLAYVQAFTEVLTPAQVNSLWTAIQYTPVTSPKVYWPHWGAGTDGLDLSGQGETATLTGTTESFDGPPVYIPQGAL